MLFDRLRRWWENRGLGNASRKGRASSGRDRGGIVGRVVPDPRADENDPTQGCGDRAGERGTDQGKAGSDRPTSPDRPGLQFIAGGGEPHPGSAVPRFGEDLDPADTTSRVEALSARDDAISERIAHKSQEMRAVHRKFRRSISPPKGIPITDPEESTA